MEKFYVYEWFIVETNEIIYVGKGSKKRCDCTQHNKLFKEMIKRFKCQSRIVSWHDTEEEAFYAESVRVEEMKKKGMACCNIMKGGFGGTHACVTEERRKQMSIKNGMKSAEQRKRMSVNNPMRDPDVARRVGLKHGKPFIYDGVVYTSLDRLSQKFEVTPTAIWYALKVGKFRGKEIKYVDNQQPSIGLTTDEGSTTRR